LRDGTSYRYETVSSRGGRVDGRRPGDLLDLGRRACVLVLEHLDLVEIDVREPVVLNAFTS